MDGSARDGASLSQAGVRAPRLRDVGLATLAGLLALLLAAPGQFTDPFAFYDDFPILFDWWPLYFEKTLSEGRWVNFAWQYLVGPLDRHAAHVVVASAWAAICAILSAAVFRGDARPWRAMLGAVAMTLAPPFTALLPWANTLVPIILIVLAYAVVAVWAPARVAVAGFFVFAVLGVMSYTTSPFIMALALVLARDWRGWERAAGLVALVGAGIGFGILLIHLLNWQVHGVFGVELDPSRVGEGGVQSAVGATAQRATLDVIAPFLFVLLLMPPLLALAVVRARSLPVLALLGCGVGLLVLIMWSTGARTPLRGMVFVWLIHVALLALVARDAQARAVRGLALGMLAVSVVLGVLYWRHFLGLVAPSQQMTTAIAEALPEGAPILVYGGPHKVPGIRNLHVDDPSRDPSVDWSVALRLHALTGRQACVCNRISAAFEPVGYCPAAETRAACVASAAAALALVPGGEMPAIGSGAGGAVIVRFAD
ncbi:MAG: hypothetical protein RQ752_07975 [Thermohalobaculum sp.]|nr:hypothetical protein [Thermohalobaculum sp.]